MRLNIYLIGAFFGMFILSSCGNDDNETPAPKDDLPSEEDEPNSIKMKTVIGMSTGIKYSENESMGINIFDLYMGVRYITLSTRSDFIYDGIQISRDTQSDEYENRYILYIPKKENPFRAEVINLTYADDTHPILEVKLDGVLYRLDNPKDSIIINGSYGTR